MVSDCLLLVPIKLLLCASEVKQVIVLKSLVMGLCGRESKGVLSGASELM
jgi:hypothetical protein